MDKSVRKIIPKKGKLKMSKGAIFDLDGVVVNTVPLHFKAWKKMFNEYGKKFTFHDYKKKVDGIPRLNGAKAILADLPAKELKRAVDKKQKYFIDLLSRKGVKVYTDTVRFIKKLRKRKIKVALISSSKNCRQILKKGKIGNLFDAVISGNDIRKGKPAPDIFLSAAKKLGLHPKECVIFEDSVLGIEAARLAQMKRIGVDRYAKPKRLRKADLVIANLREISISKLKKLV